MGTRRGWATAVVVALVVAFGAGGAVYLVKEAQRDTDDAQADGDPIGDASADARAAHGKKKPGKKAAGRRGKPRGSGRVSTSGGGGHVNTGTAGGGGPTGGGSIGGGATGGGGSIAGGGGGGGAGGAGGGGGNDPNADPDDDPNEVSGPIVRPFNGRGPAGPTYEAAIASNKQEIAIGAHGAADLTDAQLSRPMHDGGFVGECGAPDNMSVTVKVAIKTGRPVGVSVSTSPSDADVAGCIDRYVRTFAWPSNPKMDSFITTY